MRAGMPSNFVDDIYQDSHGFMWLSTQGGGLVRYDGFTFLSFGLNSKGIQLRSNNCRNVYEDRFKRLWIAFEEGFQVMSLSTLQPIVPQCVTTGLAQRLTKLSKERCKRVYCDGKGAIWLITESNIYYLSFDEKGQINRILNMRHSSTAPDLGICDVSHNGTVIMGYDGAVFEISAKSDRLTSRNITSQFSEYNALYVGAIIKYNGKIWLGTNAGLFNNGKTDNSYHRQSPPNKKIQHDVVTDLSISPTNNLLVSTLCGVDIINDSKGTIEHWNSGSLENPLSSNFVNMLYSKNGQIWVGTEAGGITKLVPRQLDLVNYYNIAGDPSSISQNAVNVIYTQPDGTLWAGVVEGGLNRKAPGSSRFTHFTTANSGLSHNSVSILAPDGEGNLWIGTWGGGINIMSLKSPQTITRLEADAAHAPSLTFIGAMIYDPINRGMWIGANEGIFFYNMQTKNIEDPFPGCRNFRGNIGCIITHDNHLLMGCLYGMADIDLKSRRQGEGHFKMKHYLYKLDNPQSGIIDKVLCLHEDGKGTIWIGSNGHGMYRCKRNADTLAVTRTYTVADGLANNTVKGIVTDNQGMLWIATSYGLSLFNPATGVFNNFYSSDGLLCSQFYFNGAARDKQGNIFLGSEKGLTEIKGKRKMQKYSGNLTFTNLLVDNQNIFADGTYIDEDISIAREVRLHESDKSFTIRFSALNYGSETQGVYSYRMKGFEDEWIQLQPGQHSVRYSTLPSGDYEFMVRYLPSIGSDKEQTISIKVHVTPFFWKSWWFILLMIICLTAFTYYIYKIRLQLMRKREADALYQPIEEALRDSNDPGKLQSRIQSILENQRRYQGSQKKTVEADKRETEEKTKPFIDSLMEVMEQNYSDSRFGVQELADAMGMSRTMLSKKLNADTGQPTIQFIRNYRLEIAKRMMEENLANRNIAEIAYRVGFNDPKYFTRCFTKYYGVAPSAYIEIRK